MSDEVGRRVFRRRVNRRKKAKFVKLHELVCFKEVEERVRSGWPISQIADFVQKERGEYTDVARESLMKTLTLYREQKGKTELLQARMPEKVEQWVKESEDAVDEVKELAKLFKLQMARINIDATNEKTIKKLFKTLGQEVFFATKILQTSAAIKMDFGLIKRAPTEIDANVGILSMDVVAHFGSDAVKKVVADPIARRKVVSLVERMAKMEAERQRQLTEGEKVLDPEAMIDAKLSK